MRGSCAFAAAAFLLILVAWFLQPRPVKEPPALPGAMKQADAPKKIGAGLLLTCNGEVLLLLRNSNHNDLTWGLPGGNLEAGDAGLLATATREAGEELGEQLPPFQVVAQVLTRRGKSLQKHYTVFVARVRPEDRAAWQPTLNHEHREWRWFPLAEAQRRADLHPVVALALQGALHRHAVAAAVLGPQQA